jgi:cation:H+ antiporter
MLTAVLLLLSGAIVLGAGGGAAVRGVTRFGRAHGVSAFALGVVLFGVHLEPLGATLVASAKDQSSIAAGTAIGTMGFLIGIGFAVALLSSKHPVEAPSVSMTLMPMAGLLLVALAVRDLQITRGEGIIMVAAYAAYLVASFRDGHDPSLRALAAEADREAGQRRRTAVPDWLLAIGGLVLIWVGATLLVDGAVRVLASGLAAGFVGAAIVGSLAAAGQTTLEVIAVRRGEFDLATGNLMGTVVAFSTGVLGIVAVIRPLPLDSSVAVALIAVAVLYTVVATAFLARGRAGRAVGATLLVLFAVWLAVAWRY